MSTTWDQTTDEYMLEQVLPDWQLCPPHLGNSEQLGEGEEDVGVGLGDVATRPTPPAPVLPGNRVARVNVSIGK